MKYRVLLKFLQFLVYIKRFFWRIGSGIYFVLALIVGAFAKVLLQLNLKFELFLKRIGVAQSREWVWKRDFLQIIVFLFLFLMTLGQTKLVPKMDLSYIGQKTLAFTLVGGDEVTGVEEVVAPSGPGAANSYSWKTGALSVTEIGQGGQTDAPQDLGTVVAGGSAITKPVLLPGAVVVGARTSESDYTIQPGDSLSSIAYEYDVSVQSIMWNNNLTARSIIKPGYVLKIPPASGVMHTVKKGDTIKKIAGLYGAKPEDIVNFNHLRADGSDLKTGEKIMVPEGKIAESRSVASTISRRTAATVSSRPAPPSSLSTPSAKGFVWPAASHLITQYYGLVHHAIDIGGPWQSAIYAAKAGTVVTSQCGWNSGYGCYIIIDHGDGIRSLYGHNSQLLVNVGDYVETGQTIALMGNTGNVRGVTGIHSHFEIQVNGGRVNPLRYVR